MILTAHRYLFRENKEVLFTVCLLPSWLRLLYPLKQRCSGADSNLVGGLVSANLAGPGGGSHSFRCWHWYHTVEISYFYYKSPSFTYTFNFRGSFQSAHLHVFLITSWHRLWFAFFKLTSSTSSLIFAVSVSCKLVRPCAWWCGFREDIQCTKRATGMLWPLEH